MKLCTSFLSLLFLLIPFLAKAQDLTGYWQGLEFEPGGYISEFWASQVQIKSDLSSELYQSASIDTGVFVLYQMKLKKTKKKKKTYFILHHNSIIKENSGNYGGEWCFGNMLLKYDKSKDALIGVSIYTTEGCSPSQIELHRLALKTKSTFCPNEEIILKVTGKNVRWYSDPLKRVLLATGNTYKPEKHVSDTFYVTQTHLKIESPTAPITVSVKESPITTLKIKEATSNQSNGTITVNANSSSLKFKLNNGSYQSSPIFTGLTNDNYEITVLDNQSCEFKASSLDYISPLFKEGVKLNENIILENLLFEENKFSIIPLSSSIINELASYMKKNPKLEIRVEGHTDYGDSFDETMDLSIKRALAVQKALVKEGIEEKRISIKGFGFTKPLYKSSNKGNRRVELVVTNK